MARPTTKTDLINEAEKAYEKLFVLIDNLTEDELLTKFDFSLDSKKKEAHWNRDENVKDVLVHLYEWHNLLLNWVNKNIEGISVPFIPDPYNWRTYGEMNIEIKEKNNSITLDDAKKKLKSSHKNVIKLAELFSNDELFSKGKYVWVGGSTLGSYFVSVTSSHYDWAMKKIRAHIKNVKNN